MREDPRSKTLFLPQTAWDVSAETKFKLCLIRANNGYHISHVTCARNDLRWPSEETSSWEL